MLGIKVIVDDKEVDLNEFVEKILNGTFVGAISSLRDINKNWKNIRIEITKS